MANVSDDEIVVDRVALRDGNVLTSIGSIIGLVSEVRRRKFDLVIDLHSLYETNLLGYLSGAPSRLFANRENRSFDRLSNFPVRPPPEDKRLHHTDRYFQALKPLDIVGSKTGFRLSPTAGQREKARDLIDTLGCSRARRVGLFLGAGHPGRRWGIDKFAALAERLSERGDTDVLVFLGPEEMSLRDEASERLSPYAHVLEPRPLPEFVAALEQLDTFVSTDTGPMHLAAVAGAAIVLITQTGAPDYFLPLTESLHIVNAAEVAEVKIDEVFGAIEESFAANDIGVGSC
jgi:ADP-heptose:LPS heptosyltransferase